jgi:hypothetical protein
MELVQDHQRPGLVLAKLNFELLHTSWGGVILSPLGTSATVWPIVPAPDGR